MFTPYNAFERTRGKYDTRYTAIIVVSAVESDGCVAVADAEYGGLVMGRRVPVESLVGCDEPLERPKMWLIGVQNLDIK